MDFPCLRDDLDRFVAPDDAEAGVDESLQEIKLRADLSDTGQVGTDPATEVANGVTRGTSCLRVVEDSLAAPDVAHGEGSLEGREALSLLGYIAL